jgi:primosomal protein N'
MARKIKSDKPEVTGALKPGDRVRVRFGRRLVEGIVTSASDGRIHVPFRLEGADEPVSEFYRESELLSARAAIHTAHLETASVVLPTAGTSEVPLTTKPGAVGK